MADRDRRHVRRSGSWLRRGSVALVVLVLVAAAAAWQLDLGSRWFGDEQPSPVTAPDKVLPPEGLSLPAARSAPAVAGTTPATAVSGDAVRRVLAPLIGSKKLGKHVVVRVAQLSDGKVVYQRGAGPVTPASTMKLLTSTAALETMGPDHRFTTRVAAAPGSRRIVLQGGGDPLLARRQPGPADDDYPRVADLTTLARTTAKQLRASHRTRVRLSYDDSLFQGPAVNPRWEPGYIPDDVVSPIHALWVDEGRDATGLGFRSADPAAAAADFFADALRKQGVTVVGKPRRGLRGDRPVVASVHSAPLAQLVQHTLEHSDNEAAEILSRQVAWSEHRQASFTGGAAAVRSVLGRLGVDTTGDRIYDGSGLSRHDRLSPQTLLSVLEAASSPDHPHLRAAVTDVPVAGFTGSLAFRFDEGDPRGLGTVRAKTGTLTGVHGLAGTATSVDGTVMVFVAIADRVTMRNNLDARVLVDRMAGALGGCRCAATP
ncbi:MAG: D-alanyl-D-alanine carboxypeptidase/D-alanyl-D-alanine-endopeptidase [Nocardioidaceae bacterium]|nr:D-alanyl-D-alanine carboxypeptidase/D-alanyl-D-alanine-endopeptidase [Nocardioidaceae bacterium]NUS49946.1 D-alanyl-D-alanine carboxypeptidase/D-alanyl-D-alanine-endopeptidase [Nocardioidaceae bacterium]